MSTNFPTREVTKILIYEVSLIEQREWFAELLGINPARRKQLGNNFNTGNISGEQYFFDLLSAWVQRLGRDANITKFCGILEGAEFKHAAGRNGLIFGIH